MSPQVNSHKHEEQKDPDEQKSFWGIRCEGGKGYSRVLSRRCNMTMAALEPNTSKAENPWLSLMMERDGSQFLLCSLKHDAIMQVPLNLIFEKGEKIKFFVRGQGTVHLSGYQEGSSADTEDNETDQKGDVEDYSTLGKTIKNGQIYCAICDTFIKSEPLWRKHIQKKKHSKNLKLGKLDKRSCSTKNIRNNPTTSNSVYPEVPPVSSDQDSSEIEEVPPNMPSGSSGKGSSGVPVKSLLSKSLVKTLSEIDDDEDDEEEDKDFNEFDEEESEEDEDEEDDDVEEDDDDSDDSDGMVNKALEAQKRKREAESLDSRKRVKKNNSMSEASTSNASQMPVEIFVEDDDDEEDDESSSEEESDDSNENESSSFKKSPLIKNAQTLKKKKKSNDSVHQTDSNSKPNSGKADDSFQVQDIRVGYGPPAKAGKIVQVFYTGKFLDGRVFDQTPAGKPFSFKLGAGQVIKGWDMGVEGMKVGGKRQIKVPPHLGYGNKEMDDIPANSTLIFYVELKSIS